MFLKYFLMDLFVYWIELVIVIIIAKNKGIKNEPACILMHLIEKQNQQQIRPIVPPVK